MQLEMVTLAAVGRAKFNMCLHDLSSETGTPWLSRESTQDMSNSC